jgi:hypothetical protein
MVSYLARDLIDLGDCLVVWFIEETTTKRHSDDVVAPVHVRCLPFRHPTMTTRRSCEYEEELESTEEMSQPTPRNTFANGTET